MKPTNMMKYITKLKKTLICDVELCYNRKNISETSTNRQIKKVKLNFVYLNNCDLLDLLSMFN